jgi:hypothetical protein
MLPTGLTVLLCLLALTGCRRRAYNDVYVENMAAEIRDLENQLYEYDHEYKLLEQELQILRQQNAALKSTEPAGKGALRSLLTPRSQSSGTDPLEFQPRSQNLPVAPEPLLQAEELPAAPDSILEPDAMPAGDASANEIPPPSAAPPQAPALRTPNSLPPASGDSAPKLPQFPGTSQDSDFDSEELLLPPTIDPGIPSPPPLPAMSQLKDGTPVSPESSLEMSLSQIEIPAEKTPARLASNRSSIKQATLQIATEKVTDTRVVELAFHPSLSRALNLDDRPDDDGLYLVLQPKNERGQMVPVAADLTIIALDPAREGKAGQVGRWDYSAAEVQSKLRPIGHEQGIHFQLPWNGPDPSADRVIVFGLYKFPDGRQVMGEKEIFISNDGSHKTVWTPRDSKGYNPTEVAAASYIAPPSPAPSSNQRPATNRESHVVRPASGTSRFEPAPQP